MSVSNCFSNRYSMFLPSRCHTVETNDSIKIFPFLNGLKYRSIWKRSIKPGVKKGRRSREAKVWVRVSRLERNDPIGDCSITSLTNWRWSLIFENERYTHASDGVNDIGIDSDIGKSNLCARWDDRPHFLIRWDTVFRQSSLQCTSESMNLTRRIHTNHWLLHRPILTEKEYGR